MQERIWFKDHRPMLGRYHADFFELGYRERLALVGENSGRSTYRLAAITDRLKHALVSR